MWKFKQPHDLKNDPQEVFTSSSFPLLSSPFLPSTQTPRPLYVAKRVAIPFLNHNRSVHRKRDTRGVSEHPESPSTRGECGEGRGGEGRGGEERGGEVR